MLPLLEILKVAYYVPWSIRRVVCDECWHEFDIFWCFCICYYTRIIISKMIYMSCVSSLEMPDVHQGKRKSFQVFEVLVSDLSVSQRSSKAEKDHVKQWPNMLFSWENISWRSTNDQRSGCKTPDFCCKFERCKKEMFTVKLLNTV